MRKEVIERTPEPVTSLTELRMLRPGSLHSGPSGIHQVRFACFDEHRQPDGPDNGIREAEGISIAIDDPESSAYFSTALVASSAPCSAICMT